MCRFRPAFRQPLGIPLRDVRRDPRDPLPGSGGKRGSDKLCVRVSQAEEGPHCCVREERRPQAVRELVQVLAGDQQPKSPGAGNGKDLRRRRADELLGDAHLVQGQHDRHRPVRTHGRPQQLVGKQSPEQAHALVAQSRRVQVDQDQAGAVPEASEVEGGAPGAEQGTQEGGPQQLAELVEDRGDGGGSLGLAPGGELGQEKIPCFFIRHVAAGPVMRRRQPKQAFPVVVALEQTGQLEEGQDRARR